MGQRFLDSVGVCSKRPLRNYLRELCIISNILSVLVPHLFYFILFLDPLYIYIYVFVYLSPPIPSFSFSLPLSFLLLLFFNFSSIQCFPFPDSFHSFLHFSFTALFTLFRSRLPSTFAHFLSTAVSRSPLCITHFRNFDIHLLFQSYICAILAALVVDRVYFFRDFSFFFFFFLHRSATSQNYHFITL